MPFITKSLKRSAIETLAKIRTPDAIKWLLKARTDNDAEVRFHATSTLTALRREYEGLYADGNMDFAGKYRLRAAPYIFEPTFGDDFVHGYSGPGIAHPKTELLRRARPEEQKAE